jgi:hypothetical protein
VTYPWALLFPGSSTFPGGPILPSYPIQVTPALITVDGVDIGVNRGDVTITFTDLKGWFDGPGSRASFVDRPNDHGSFDGPVYRSNRVISIEGAAYADSRAAVAAALHTITGILAEGDLGPLTVADPDYGTLTAMVRLTDGPSITWNRTTQQWTFQIQFTAPDPRKYAAQLTWPTGLPVPAVNGLTFPLFNGTGKLEFGPAGQTGQITMTNPGTADAYATFAIAGPVIGGVVLTEVATGRSIVWADDVPDHDVLLIVDSQSGRATLNGADRSGELITKQWWPVKRRSSSTVQFSTLGAAGQAGQLTASLRPAYW